MTFVHHHTYAELTLWEIIQTKLFASFVFLFALENIVIVYFRNKHLQYSAGLPENGIVSAQMVDQIMRFGKIEYGFDVLLICTLLLFAGLAFLRLGLTSTLKFMALTMVFNQIGKGLILTVGRFFSDYPIDYTGQLMLVHTWLIYILGFLGIGWFFVEYIGVRIRSKSIT